MDIEGKPAASPSAATRSLQTTLATLISLQISRSAYAKEWASVGLPPREPQREPQQRGSEAGSKGRAYNWRPIISLVSSNETRVVVLSVDLGDRRIDGCLQGGPCFGRVVEVLRLGSGVGRQLAR